MDVFPRIPSSTEPGPARRSGVVSRYTALLFTMSILAGLFLPALARAGAGFAFVTTTDFSSGSSTTIDASAPWNTSLNVASVHSDAVARVFEDYIYVVNRYLGDNIQILDPNNGFSTVKQFSVGARSDPHDIMVITPTKAYVTRYNATTLWIVDPSTGSMTGSIDLSPWADADGVPEMDTMARAGNRVFVTLQRLDNTTYTPAGTSYVIVIDAGTDTVVDADPVVPGTQAITLTGANPFSEIRFPYNGLLYVSCVGFLGLQDGGIEFIDPVSLQSTGYFLTETAAGGDINDVSITAVDQGYCIVADASFNTILKEFNPQTGTVTATVFNPGGYVLRDIEESPTGGELFLADRTVLNPGIRIFDVTTNAQITTSPISTGLPPYDITFSMPIQTGVGDTPPAGTSLGPNYPNPFNPMTTIPFSLEREGYVSLRIYDARGVLVRALIEAHQPAGRGEVRWNGLDGESRAVPSGVYFARLQAAGMVMTRKIVLLK